MHLRPALTRTRSAHWRSRIRSGPLGEAGAMQLLTAYGIPAVACIEVEGVKSALQAASAIGWPVAVKTAAPEISAQDRTRRCPVAHRRRRGASECV